MHLRNVGRWAASVVQATFAFGTLVACGTSGQFAADAGDVDTGTGVSLYVGDATSNSVTSCVSKSCVELGYTCGKNSDGCGNVIDCGTCNAPDFCGGAGYSKCGTVSNALADGAAPDAASASPCVAQSCADQGFDCGYAGDGCGKSINCGDPSACPGNEYCGGGGPQKCGGDSTVQEDGGPAPVCMPKTCADLGYDCGYTGDGCGNVLDCNAADAGSGGCPGVEYCGGGGPNKCGGSVFTAADGGNVDLCTPQTCSGLGFDCGYVGDGCGNLLNCNSTTDGGAICPGVEYCGGGGSNKCGGSIYVAADGGTVDLCQPTTCAALGYDCGPTSDGCGHLLQCGSCYGADTCGGAGTAGVCGHTCGGLCQDQASCAGGTPTTITGRVLAGKSAWTGLPPDPVPNVLVYVPNGTVAPMSHGYAANACPQCGADVTGDPLVSTYTDYDGTFTLSNVPSPPNGQTLPLVIQLGRWRRQLTIASPTACTVTRIGDLNLPRNHNEGDIPLTAISTGAVDALECVLLKMGVDQAEFTSSSAATPGRVHVYAAGPGTEISKGVGPGAYIADPNSTMSPPASISQPETALMATGGSYMSYDQIMLPCWGSAVGFKPKSTNNLRSTDEPGDLVTYADSGGHFFATHYSYSWLVGNGEFNSVAQWDPDDNNPGNVTWTLNVSKSPPVVPAPMHSGIFWQWLNGVKALSNYNLTTPPQSPQVSIAEPRHDADGVASGSLDWIDGTDPQKNTAMLEHFTFNTPVNKTSQCGHAIFSDFHVASETDTNSTPFPNECTTTFSAQEKILEYMIFDLASCVTPPASTCKPLTCGQQGLSCGMAGDGCGNPIDCGACASPLTCGGAGIRGQCGAPDGGACSPLTCAQQGLSCGPAGDGCGNPIDCGECASGQTCGGGGVAGHCGQPEAGACVPETCASQNIGCGPAGDGCGNQIDCGTCNEGTCGGGGVPNQCGQPLTNACEPQTCAMEHIGCGPAGDGCGNLVQCGTCPAGQTCGGGGVAGQCGGGACQPYTCASLGYTCGPAGDGCGNLLECGTCTGSATCGGGGTPGQCGSGNGPK